MTTDTHPTDTQTITFFAYGTLRKGQHLHGWIEGEVIESIGTGKMKFAKLFFPQRHRSFPYLTFTSSPSDETVGEVYTLPMSERVMQMLQMEMNAGYKIMEADVEVNGETMQVVVCAWDREVGDPITGNDWVLESGKEPW